MQEMPDSSAPIFILSCERAGSTLLRFIMDTHPDVCSPGELVLGRVCESLLHMVSSTSIDQPITAFNEMARYRASFQEVRKIVSGWLDAYAKSKGKKIWCEKTPLNVQYREILNDVYPDAKFICLHRNCMDVVHSCVEAVKSAFYIELFYYARNLPPPFTRGGSNSIGVFVDSWIDKTNKMLMFEREHPLKCFRIKYESIVTNPVETLGPLFEFAGLGLDPSMLDSVFFAPHDAGLGDTKVWFSRKIHRNSIGLGSSISRLHIPKDLLERMNALLEELGYPIVGSDWDRAPSPYITPEMKEYTHDQFVSGVEEIFSIYLPQRLKLRYDRLAGINKKCKFSLTDVAEKAWVIDLTELMVKLADRNEDADCTITISGRDLIDIVNGELNAASAFECGKLRVAGDLKLAMTVGAVLFGG